MKILPIILLSIISFVYLSDSKSLPVEKEEKEIVYKDTFINHYWYCPGCGNVNPEENSSCRICGRSK